MDQAGLLVESHGRVRLEVALHHQAHHEERVEHALLAPVGNLHNIIKHERALAEPRKLTWLEW
jgi:hypothetical protein